MSALVANGGVRIRLDIDRWRGVADTTERSLLAELPDAVLDVGCGPGRIAAALAAAGRDALGIDTSPAAVRAARARGAVAQVASVFDSLPRRGTWGSVVLLDGNIGIGGDPVALLRRVRQLLRPGGVVLVEVDDPGVPAERLLVRIETPAGGGPRFAWARVGADAVHAVAAAAGLHLDDVARRDGRWFATAVRR